MKKLGIESKAASLPAGEEEFYTLCSMGGERSAFLGFFAPAPGPISLHPLRLGFVLGRCPLSPYTRRRRRNR
jgi:hypothetical protein